MKYINQRSVEKVLTSNIKSDEKYLDSDNPYYASQAKKNTEVLKQCLESERSKQLVTEWNSLLARAQEIQGEANSIHPIFGRNFRLD